MDAQKIAVITGAYRGIGFETARQLVQRGWQVYLTARKKKEGEAAAKKLDSSGERVRFLEMDVAERDSIETAAAAFGKGADHLDALINNAAIHQEGESLLKTEPDLLAEMIWTNAVGPLMVTQAFVPYLKKKSGSRVINVSSGAGSLTDMTLYAPAYSVSKTTLNAITRQLSLALKSDGIAVNSVCPGWVRTEMGGPNAPRSVEEGVETIVWLAGEAPASTTGQFLRDRKPVAW